MTLVFVTGGAGFLGSWVTEFLIKEGYDVLVVDDLSTGKLENLPRGCAFLRVDLRDEEQLKVAFEKKPEIVAHYAAQASVRVSLKRPRFDAEVNVLGCLNLLELCRTHDVEKFVFASSGGAVYGEPLYLPVDERHPTNPMSPYGVSKLACEKYLETYRKLYGISAISLRYANVYGPRQDPLGEAGVIAIFAHKMLAGERPVIYGDGNQTRDFLYASDAAEACLAAINSKAEGVFNVGSGVETSVNEVFQMLRSITGRDVEPSYDAPLPGEVRRICLNPELAWKELSWRATTSLREGLKLTVEWFRGSF